MGLAADLMTAELYAAIGQAMLKNDEIQRQHPDEKPPLGDGVPYASFPDAADECAVDYAGAAVHPAEVAVTYRIAGAPDAGWTDTLILRQVDGEWQLDDIVYADGGRLSEALKGAFELD
jgi:hypothetical protein